jgi:spore maturation protein A
VSNVFFIVFLDFLRFFSEYLLNWEHMVQLKGGSVMVLSLVWAIVILLSIVFGVTNRQMAGVSASVAQGAQSGITVAIGIAGSICLWSGVGNLMDKIGLTRVLSKFLRPLLNLIFPTTKKDPQLRQDLSANICANILGLGNAATPMGIKAVKRMRRADQPGLATDEMCRLIVLNTASIQLIPANVAAIRASLGSGSPFEILPAVWVTSIVSASVGLGAAWLLGKLWRHG